VYEDIYRSGDREKMAALPEGWLPSNNGISVQFGDGRGYETLAFNGAFYSDMWSMGKPREVVQRLVAYKHDRGCAKVYEPEHRFTKRHAELSARLVALK